MSAADERNHDIPIKGMPRLHRTAEQHHLWFTVEVPLTEDSILADLHYGIKHHFTCSRLTLPEGEDPEDLTDFTTLPWQLLKMVRRRKSQNWDLRIDDELLARHITIRNLKKLVKCKNPASATEALWVIISAWLSLPGRVPIADCCSFQIPRSVMLSAPLAHSGHMHSRSPQTRNLATIASQTDLCCRHAGPSSERKWPPQQNAERNVPRLR